MLIADIVYTRASVSDIDDNPDAYLGNRVTVYGEASELVGATGFRLEDPGFFAGDDVLVLMREEAMTVAEDTCYYVTGTVQRFTWPTPRPSLATTLTTRCSATGRIGRLLRPWRNRAN